MLLLVLSGFVLLRIDARQLLELLFQLPPRKTRFEPCRNGAAGHTTSCQHAERPTCGTTRVPASANMAGFS